jgi:hypothetical protein
MRAFGNKPQRWPPWITATLIFLVLIAVIQIVGRTQPQRLQQTFGAAPPDANAGQIPLPPVPTDLVGLARTATARMRAGLAGAPLTRQAQNESIRVQIDSITPEGESLRLAGGVTNISSAPVAISLDSFKFIDSSGTSYASSGSPATTLEPQQQAPLDITLPIKDPTLLKLEVAPTGQAMFELTLINTAPTPTP